MSDEQMQYKLCIFPEFMYTPSLKNPPRKYTSYVGNVLKSFKPTNIS